MNRASPPAAWWGKSTAVRLLFPRGHGFAVGGELAKMGFAVRTEGPSFVEVAATPRDAIRICMWSRSAHRVVVPLREFSARSLDQFAAECSRIPWETIAGPDHPVTVTCAVQNRAIRDSRIVNLRCKDVIVDRLAEVHGRRPDSGPGREALRLRPLARAPLLVSVDLCGEPLSSRATGASRSRRPCASRWPRPSSSPPDTTVRSRW
ncbi:MAG: THUMP domain-containing protein [Kiritimatiellia bacterium]